MVTTYSHVCDINASWDFGSSDVSRLWYGMFEAGQARQQAEIRGRDAMKHALTMARPYN